MVALGRVNSRMKDFYDICMLSRRYDFDAARLARAIAATFDRRRTPIPAAAPDALSPAFAADAAKQAQRRAFGADVALAPSALDVVVADLAAFLMPRAIAARASAI